MRLSCSQTNPIAKYDTLFLHGNLASSRWWEPTLASWTNGETQGTGRFVCADLRGCGRNPPLTEGDSFTLKDLASDVLEVIREKQMNNVAIVGHSLGGLVAIQALTMAPELFNNAVLLDPVGLRGVVFDESLYEAFRQMALSRELTQTVILSTVQNAEHLSAETREWVTDDAFKAVAGVGRSVLEILKTVDLTSACDRVQVPTLILHGQHDQVIPLRDSQTMAQTLPRATLEIVPEAGHCWNLESPEALAKRLRNWWS